MANPPGAPFIHMPPPPPPAPQAKPKRNPPSPEERMLVLKMLEEGKISVEQAEQLLAAMGELLTYLKSPMPMDAHPLDTRPLGLWPTKFPPILWGVPPGSAPLDVSKKRAGALDPGVIRATEPPFGFTALWPTGTQTASAYSKPGQKGSAQQWLALESGAKPSRQAELENAFPVTSFASSYSDVSNWPFKQ